MRPSTSKVPKCLLPVAGLPFVDWQLSWLASEGIDRVVYSIGHLGELVRRHLGDGRRFGLDVAYADERDRPLGTAGALRLAADSGLLDPDFLVVYGDSYLQVRLETVEAEYRTRRLPVLMTVYRDPGRLELPNVVFEGGMVVRYQKGLAEPPPEMRHVDYGLSVWQRDVVQTIVPSDQKVDLAVPLAALSASGRLAGYEVHHRFYEIGSPRGLADLDEHLRSQRGPNGSPLPGPVPAERAER